MAKNIIEALACNAHLLVRKFKISHYGISSHLDSGISHRMFGFVALVGIRA